ncbi:hypothetical protein H0H92_000824 [Tricholoma furcatifolium]|nr:hypothetical protein H0H92_000824 [Tricholoma furcatifolium]
MTFSVSTPSSRKSPSPTHYHQRTNTITITSLPKSYFLPIILNVLRDHFATFGEINRWAPITAFGRIMVVYRSEDDAETAKQQCDPIVIEQSQDRPEVVLRVYRADPNPLTAEDMFGNIIPEENYLHPPVTGKNFLISPPGSPPVGWKQIREDPPNANPLADDLMQALRKLQLQERRRGSEILLDSGEGSGVSVYLEDCGAGDDNGDPEDWVYGETAPTRDRWPRTALPPMVA